MPDFGRKYPIKDPILRLSSALVKVYQISPVIFQTTSHFLYFFQTLHQSSVSWKIAPLYFAQKELIKANIFKKFWVLGSKFVKFHISILQQQVSSSSDFASIFSDMKDNSSALL